MYSTYWGDGDGRDSYVVFGNGGQRKEPQPQSWVSAQEQLQTNSSNGGGWRAFTNSKPEPAYDPKKLAFSGPRPNMLTYYGDGSGRDGYVISQYPGGNLREYRGPLDFHKDWVRGAYETPIMDKRMQDPQMVSATYNNDYVSRQQRVKFVEQRSSVDRLQRSPPRQNF